MKDNISLAVWGWEGAWCWWGWEGKKRDCRNAQLNFEEWWIYLLFWLCWRFHGCKYRSKYIQLHSLKWGVINIPWANLLIWFLLIIIECYFWGHGSRKNKVWDKHDKRIFNQRITQHRGFPGGSDGKKSACSAGDLGLIPCSRRSPGEGNGDPLQYSCLDNWWATVHGVAKSQTQLSD